MPPSARVAVAVGLRVKSGAATVVLLVGPRESPRAIDARQLTLCDPSVPATKQPYHSGFGTAQDDSAVIARLTRIVERCARRSISSVIDDYRSRGYDLRRAGLVVGSDIDPSTIRNPHIRAHASEGRLFRRVTEGELIRAGLTCSIWIERELYAIAAEQLGKPEEVVRRAAAAFGRDVEGRWRADEKSAAVAAWIALGRPAGASTTFPERSQSAGFRMARGTRRAPRRR